MVVRAAAKPAAGVPRAIGAGSGPVHTWGRGVSLPEGTDCAGANTEPEAPGTVETMDAPLHADVLPIAFLLGTWHGEGVGQYPTIDPFRYGEEMVFEDVGDTFLLYAERSWRLDDGSPVHFERGFLRPAGDGAVELVLAHPIGVTEIAHGRVDGTTMDLATGAGDVGRTRTGLDVTGLTRHYRVDGDVLAYRLDMATERTPMSLHLEAEVRRIG
jgi:THAP4-like, heme-binding beta-barrel domain